MNDRKRALWGYIFVTPQLIGLIAFSLIPLVYAFHLATTRWDGFGDKLPVGFGNIIEQLGSKDFQLALLNTVKYAAIVIPLSIGLGVLLALALNNVRGKQVYRLIYFMPQVTSAVSIGVIWTWILNGDFGILNYLLGKVGIDGPNWLADRRWVIPSIALVSIWWTLGYNLVISLAGLQGISRSYYEAAEIDGASGVQKFFYITLPLLSPTMFFLTIMGVISSFQVFDQAFVMTGGGPAKASYTVVYHIYDQAFTYFHMGESAAAAVILFFIILIFTAIQFGMSKRWVHYEG